MHNAHCSLHNLYQENCRNPPAVSLHKPASSSGFSIYVLPNELIIAIARHAGPRGSHALRSTSKTCNKVITPYDVAFAEACWRLQKFPLAYDDWHNTKWWYPAHRKDCDKCLWNWACAKGHLRILHAFYPEIMGRGQQSITYGASLAVKHDQPTVLREMIALGADIHDTEEQLVREACLHKRIEVIKILLEAGVSTTVSHGDTPFFVAAQLCHTEVVRTLLDSGRDFSDDFLSGIREASRWGGMEIVELILDASTCYEPPVESMSVLAEAALCNIARKGDNEMVDFCLEAGANPNAQGVLSRRRWGASDFRRHPGYSPHAARRSLVAGVESGDVLTVQLLLDAGADVQLFDDRAMQVAVQKRDGEMMKLLHKGTRRKKSQTSCRRKKQTWKKLWCVDWEDDGPVV
ncbi:hypothetical protein HDV00_003939 [Rhizophlyctis rosea]|nr:hypothetical protein HDV00_003939 [Rhizophlyctis rosea]